MATGGSTNKLNDDELLKLGSLDLLRHLRVAETENMRLMMDHGALMKEVNRRMQVHLLEIRGLKEVNQRLQDDNQELRDLCCFLDDDRQKGRKLAREWQRFGRYTASVMRQEVSAYQTKLHELEEKQEELIKDNLELKELCLYLDEERVGSRSSLCSQCSTVIRGLRDDGDGSSASTNTEESSPSHPHERILPGENFPRTKNIISEQILFYIRSLEERVFHLEEEQKPLSQKVQRYGNASRLDGKHYCPPYPVDCYQDTGNCLNRPDLTSIPGKPEAVVHAMKVLEVHEQLDKQTNDYTREDLSDREKALVREMCNVVWRKLEEGPGTQN